MLQLRKLMDRAIEVFACLVMAVMLFVSVWQIVSRYVFQNPIIFSEEFLRYALIWMAVIGIAYGIGKSEHIALDFIKDVPPKTQLMLALFTQIAFILFAACVMVAGGIQAVNVALSQVSPVLEVSMGTIYLALPVGGVLSVIYSLMNMADLLTEHKVTHAHTRIEAGEMSQIELEGEKNAA